MFDKTIIEAIEKWLEENSDVLLKNISLTIHNWMEINKEEIFKIIKEEVKK